MTRVFLDKIIKKPKKNTFGLADIHYEDYKYYCPMTVGFFDELKDEKIIDVDINIYAYDDYDVFENEEDFLKQKENSMAPESIVAIGNFCIENEGFKKSSENFINGKVINIQENEDNYYVELECLNIIFHAIYKKTKKIEKGNIISSMYKTEIELIKDLNENIFS